MDIDWKNPPVLIGEKRRETLRKRAAREHIRLRKKRKGKKNHSVNRERSREDKARAAAIKEKVEGNREKAYAYFKAVREYWTGARDEHPNKPEF